MRRFSPYNYAFDNPIRYLDPDGMQPLDDIYKKNGKVIARVETDDKFDRIINVTSGTVTIHPDGGVEVSSDYASSGMTTNYHQSSSKDKGRSVSPSAKPSTTVEDKSTKEAVQAVVTGTTITTTTIDAGLDAAQRTGVMIAVPSKAADGTIDIMEKANDFGKAGKALGSTVKTMGVVGGIVDAAGAVGDAFEVYNNPNSTKMEVAGAITKAVFKSALVFAKMNPFISIGLGILDMTGATDALFKW